MTACSTITRQGLADLLLAQQGAVGPTDEFAQHRSRARRLLESLHVGWGDIVSVPFANPGGAIATILESWSAGAVVHPTARYQPLDQPAGRRSHMATIVFSALVEDAIRVAPAAETEPFPHFSETALLHQTSGSSGVAKIVKRSVASIAVEADGYQQALGFTAGETIATMAPLHHSYGSGLALAAIAAGCQLQVHSAALPRPVADRLDRGGVDFLVCAPPQAKLLCMTRPTGASALRAALAGAGPTSPELDQRFSERFGCRLLRGYGSTETGGTFVGATGIGAPTSAVDRVATPGPGQIGELRLELVATVLGSIDSSHPTTSWRTGDIATAPEKGVSDYAVLGRMSLNELRLNGRFHDVSDLNLALRDDPGVTDHGCLALDIDHSGVEICVLAIESTVYDTELAKEAYGPLLRPFGSGRVVALPSFPRDEIGKVSRRELIAALRAGG